MKFNTDYSALAHHWVYNFDYSECYGNRMFSEKETIYSYGRHYAIARKVETKNDGIIFLVNSDNYSATTSKQTHCVVLAIPSFKTVFKVPGACLNHNDNIKHFYFKITEYCIKESRARTVDYKHEIRHYLNKLQEYVRIFPQDKRKWTKVFKQLINCDVNNDEEINNISVLLTGISNEKERKAKKKARIASKKAVEKAKGDLIKWRNFELSNGYSLRPLKENFLRYNKKLEVIEVSNGASIRLSEAKLFWRKVKSGDKLLNENVGYYNIVRAGKSFVIGCTELSRSELNNACKEIELEEIF